MADVMAVAKVARTAGAALAVAARVAVTGIADPGAAGERRPRGVRAAARALTPQYLRRPIQEKVGAMVGPRSLRRERFALLKR